MPAPETVHQVQTRRLSASTWEVYYPQFGVALVFRALRDNRDSITAEISAYAGDIWLNLTRANLLTHQWRRGFAESLSERYQACPWREVLDDACLRVLVDYRRPSEPVSLARLAVLQQAEQYTAEPILYDGVPTVLAGDGGVGKSTIALALAVSVATGQEVLPGVRPVRTGPVIYMDWEDRAHVHAQRLRQLCAGLGIAAPEDVYHQEMTAPLPDTIEEAQEQIARLDAVLCICDSLALAAGGEPEAGQSALDYFRALHSLGLASLSIAHVAKADLREGEVRPYGSVFVRNSARAVWSVRQQDLGGSLVLEVRQEKTNRGRQVAPLRWRMRWERDAIVISDLSDTELARMAGPTDDRVLAALRTLWDQRAAQGRPPEVRRSEVALLTGLPRSTVWSALDRLVARGLAVQVAPARPGEAALYMPPRDEAAVGEDWEDDPGDTPF